MLLRKKIELRPQAGPQTTFHSTPADIAIYGGGAGGGKSWSLLFEPLRHMNVSGFRGTIFRRESAQITIPGGLWDEAQGMYTEVGLKPREAPILDFRNPRGSQAWKLKFAGLQHEKDKFNWQGGQLAYGGWDELTHFLASQFWYIQSRMRSLCGVAPYTRATCNPDADSWVADLLAWWIEQDENSENYGYPIKERAGVLRWYIRSGDEFVWADSKEELIAKYPNDGKFAKSLTFIPASVYDNQILMQGDPLYEATLRSLSLVERERLLRGNWKIRFVAGNVFRRPWFQIVDAAPADAIRIRYWDRASTEEPKENDEKKDPDWTAGVLLSRDRAGIFYVEHVERFRETPYKVEEAIKKIASQDGLETNIGIEQDPGQAGVYEGNSYVRALAGFKVKCYPVTTDKVSRAKPVSAQAEAGNIKLVRGAWNKAFLSELESFPSKKVHDDQVDALSGAFKAIVGDKVAPAKPKIWTVRR